MRGDDNLFDPSYDDRTRDETEDEEREDRSVGALWEAIERCQFEGFDH